MICSFDISSDARITGVRQSRRQTEIIHSSLIPPTRIVFYSKAAHFILLGALLVTVHFAKKFQGGGDFPHVTLIGARPAFNIAELLEARVEPVYQEEPGSGLFCKVGSVQVQLFGLRVQPFLVQISLS